MPTPKQDFTATRKVDASEVFRLAEDRDLMEIAFIFLLAFNEAMDQVKSQMESENYHPDKEQGPHLAISFTSTGIPNG